MQKKKKKDTTTIELIPLFSHPILQLYLYFVMWDGTTRKHTNYQRKTTTPNYTKHISHLTSQKTQRNAANSQLKAKNENIIKSKCIPFLIWMIYLYLFSSLIFLL